MCGELALWRCKSVGRISGPDIPLALYTDRHPVFRHRSGYQPAGAPTQFGRAMAELGAEMIFARSPRAKGRVERTAGTFQGRLITELRLAGATTIEQAKAVLEQFLPRFNRRFQVPAQRPEPAFQPLPPDPRLEQVRCFKHRGRVGRDNTVKFQRPSCSCGPGRSAAAMPVRLSRCCRDWTASCRSSTRDAALLPRRRRPVRRSRNHHRIITVHRSARSQRVDHSRDGNPSQTRYGAIRRKCSWRDR